MTADADGVVAECVRALRFGGWLFVYGQPRELSSWGEHLVRSGGETWRMVFKYWIAMEIDAAPRDGFLKPGHRGLLMFLKTDPRRKSPMPFHLNTAEVKVPHAFCAACKANVKDWGGKKHLMNPKGTALSDVWRDLPQTRLKNSLTPDAVLERIRALTESEGERGLHVVQVGVQALACPGGTLKRGLQRADQEIGAPALERDQRSSGRLRFISRTRCRSSIRKACLISRLLIRLTIWQRITTTTTTRSPTSITSNGAIAGSTAWRARSSPAAACLC